jgi:H+/Cl- antiporter ClcA
MLSKYNFKVQLAVLFVVVVALSIDNNAYAQGPVTGEGIEISDVMTLENISVVASAFILSAIGWAVLGWQKKRRTAKTPIDPKKLLKTIIIGVLVGVLAFGYTLFFGNDSLEYLHITTFEGYKQLLMWTFPAIVTLVVVLKKMFPDLGRLTNGIDSNITEPIDDTDDLPPGKMSVESSAV